MRCGSAWWIAAPIWASLTATVIGGPVSSFDCKSRKEFINKVVDELYLSNIEFSKEINLNTGNDGSFWKVNAFGFINIRYGFKPWMRPVDKKDSTDLVSVSFEYMSRSKEIIYVDDIDRCIRIDVFEIPARERFLETAEQVVKFGAIQKREQIFDLINGVNFPADK